jgi:DNA-binding NarL/FixJ family response regulator
MLETRPELEVVGEAADGLEAVQKAGELQPDIVLLDLSMPNLNGIDASKIIRERCPKSRIVFLTENADAEIREWALRTGARGYVLKARAPHDLFDTITAVVRAY